MLPHILPASDRNETTRVVARFTEEEWSRDGDSYRMAITLPTLAGDAYVRVRGTNTRDLEPQMDVPGENPWADLWFYSNPIFIEVEEPGQISLARSQVSDFL